MGKIPCVHEKEDTKLSRQPISHQSNLALVPRLVKHGGEERLIVVPVCAHCRKPMLRADGWIQVTALPNGSLSTKFLCPRCRKQERGVEHGYLPVTAVIQPVQGLW
jgi:hypothetical protein